MTKYSKYQPIVTVEHDDDGTVTRVEVDWVQSQIDVDTATGEWQGAQLPTDEEQETLANHFDAFLVQHLGAEHGMTVLHPRPRYLGGATKDATKSTGDDIDQDPDLVYEIPGNAEERDPENERLRAVVDAARAFRDTVPHPRKRGQLGHEEWLRLRDALELATDSFHRRQGETS